MCCTPTWQRIPSASYQVPRGPAVMGALIDPDRMTGAPDGDFLTLTREPSWIETST
jgi:hypothetical protein